VIVRYVVSGAIALVGISGAVLLALWRARVEGRRAEQPPSPAVRLPGRVAPAEDVTRLPTRPLASFDPPAGAPEDGLDWLAQAVDEVRMPINVLREQVELVRRHAAAEASPALVALIERLAAQVEQAHSVIAGWVTTGMPVVAVAATRRIDLRALARDFAIALAPATAPPGVASGGPPVWVRLAPATLEEALAVLLHNSWDAAPAEVVEVAVRVITAGEQYIALTIADRRPTAIRAVWDDLELDFVRVLLEEYHGTLEVAPRGGSGRLTTIWLPGTWLAGSDDAAASHSPPPPAQVHSLAS
jgi:hypothetical protein